jgi:hypothetical protein
MMSLYKSYIRMLNYMVLSQTNRKVLVSISHKFCDVRKTGNKL